MWCVIDGEILLQNISKKKCNRKIYISTLNSLYILYNIKIKEKKTEIKYIAWPKAWFDRSKYTISRRISSICIENEVNEDGFFCINFVSKIRNNI